MASMSDSKDRSFRQWAVIAVLAAIILVALATVALTWVPASLIGGVMIAGGDLSTTAAGVSALGTLILALVTYLSLQLARDERDLQEDQLNQLKKEHERRNVEQLIRETIDPLLGMLRHAREMCNGSVGYEYREDRESTTDLPELDERSEYDIVDQEYLTEEYPEIWDDIEEYNNTKSAVAKCLDDQYEAYFDAFKLYCYPRADEFDMDPEERASMMAYAQFGEWQGEVDEERWDRGPLADGISAVAEMKGREGSIEYSSEYPSTTTLDRKARTIEENLVQMKEMLQRKYEVRSG